MSNDLPLRPGYFALRLGADLSSAIRNQTIHFAYRPGTLYVEEGPGGVPVFTPPSAVSRPQVTSVLVSVDGLEPYSLDGQACSALFWSESAVEKFLLPYFVSAAGPHAAEVLGNITSAFYNYADANPVCALAFSYPSQPLVGPMQLWDALQVVYMDGTSMTAKSLKQFLELPLGPDVINTPPPLQPQGEQPAARSPLATPVDCLGVREVAEFVSGLRGSVVDVYMVQLPGGLEPVLTPQTVSGGTLRFSAFSPDVRQGRLQPTVKVQLADEGDPITITGNAAGPEYDPDALFWTDGAVDTLMLPYYASVQGQWAPWYQMLILGTWSGAIPAQVVQNDVLLQMLGEQAGQLVQDLAGEPGTVVLLDAVEGDDPVAPEYKSQVYGLVHLPRSEWVDETEQVTVTETVYLEHRTGALTRNGSYPLVAPPGRLVPRPLRG